MLVIGHRGSAGSAAENSLAAGQAGLESGADILEFDVRLTKDGVPVLGHDNRLIYHQMNKKIADLSWKELEKLTAAHVAPVISLEAALKECFGKIMLNFELKTRGSGAQSLKILESKFIKNPNDWDKFFFSSFFPAELKRARKASPDVALALLNTYNPFAFVNYHRQLELSAVGFHRLHTNRLATEIAKQTGLFTYAYTVNRPQAAVELEKQGFDGIVTDYPAEMVTALNQ